MADLDRKALGRIGEEAAALYLEKKGYSITGRNVRVGRSEIDIICENEYVIAFAEVKTRRQKPDTKSPFGSPASAVDMDKQASLIRGADGYMVNNPTEKIPRIDVIEVYVSGGGNFSVTEIRHFENAVTKSGKFTKNSQKRRNRHETD